MIRVMSAARRVGRTAGGFLFYEYYIVHMHDDVRECVYFRKKLRFYLTNKVK